MNVASPQERRGLGNPLLSGRCKVLASVLVKFPLVVLSTAEDNLSTDIGSDQFLFLTIEVVTNSRDGDRLLVN